MMNKHITAAKPQSGATLIELIVSIVVISVALTGLMMTISISMRHSADGFVQIRAAELAQAYMDMLVTMEYQPENNTNPLLNPLSQLDLNDFCGNTTEYPGNIERENDMFYSIACYEYYDFNGTDRSWIEDMPPRKIGGQLVHNYDNYGVRFRVSPDTLNSVTGRLIEVRVSPSPVHEEIVFSTFRAPF